MIIYTVDGGDTFEGTALEADDCFGISSEIESFTPDEVIDVLKQIFRNSKVEYHETQT